ncbi:hypothetical protein QYF61_022859 [Mycteria americana]|uniref:LRRNT domain-containing protein n=1 Tax=Mycteria americana TaxID=33587 RepID=A0AAN7N5F4_MYCAM|nr:hypothetical protein QYF61_022859 [Mycteria americana]
MPAGGRARLALGLLGLLALGCAAARLPPPADNDFPEGAPERRRPPGPGPACPRDCGCTQEGVVDCGGIDLKEFPLLLPELTNHLSLQVREPSPGRGIPDRRGPPGSQTGRRPPLGSPGAAHARVPAFAWARLLPASLSGSSASRWKREVPQAQRLHSTKAPGLPEEAFEHLENLNYLYLANNKAEQPQLSQPVFVEEVLQPSDHFHGPPLDSLQQLHVLLVLRAPELDAELQDMVGLLGCECTLLACVQLFVHQYPQVLFHRAALDRIIPQPVLKPRIALTQVVTNLIFPYSGRGFTPLVPNMLSIDSGGLTVAPKFLPNTLISADFAANYLTKIYGLTFGQKPNLRSVYLHNNKLSDAGLPDNMFNGSDNVEILIMSSNFLKKLSSLEYLDLSSNNLSQIPSGLPRNIVLLHLEKNAIKVIGRDVLTQIKNLEYLLLHNNKLKARGIHPLAFQGLKKLHTVHLYNNMLERIPSGLPRRVKTLMILHNQISEINRNDFATTYFLEELNLSYNKLKSPQIHREAFRKLRQLKSLDLSGNNLHTVPFGFPKNLQILKLKENEISIIPKGTLSGMTKLRELYLSNNKLKSLDMAGNQLTSIPSDLPESLEYLYLQNNKITTVSENAFESTPKIKGIYLRFNKIAVGALKETTFQNLKHLQVLDIEGNLEFSNSSKNKDDSEEEMEDEEEEEELR